jgi:dolichol-phosphate mannosyltransferase
MLTEPKRIRITFLVTALNEEEEIEDTVRTIIQAAGERIEQYEILLVDDGSTDSTASIMDRLAGTNATIRVIHNEKNLGLGGAYKRGLQDARMEYVMWVSGDNAETVENLANIASHAGEADIVIPVLLDHPNRPAIRRITSRVFTMLVNLLFGLRVRYYNGAVLHRASLIRSVDIVTDSFAYQAEALIKLLRRGHSYVEIPYYSATYDGIFSNAMRPKNLLGVVKALSRTFIDERMRIRSRS